MPSVSDFPVQDSSRVLTARVAGMSVQGADREQNEDRYFVDPGGRCFAIADGIGGVNGGGVASGIACQVLQEELTQMVGDHESLLEYDFYAPADLRERTCSSLLDILRSANDAIRREQQTSWCCADMGTTAIAAVVIDGQLYLANIGDSRAFIVRDGVTCRLTSDHTIAAGLLAAGLLTPQEASVHHYRDVLYKYLGAWSDSDPADVRVTPLQDGDCLVLATDGVTDCVDEEQFAVVCGQLTAPRDVAAELIGSAIANGATDDTTCVAAYFE